MWTWSASPWGPHRRFCTVGSALRHLLFTWTLSRSQLYPSHIILSMACFFIFLIFFFSDRLEDAMLMLSIHSWSIFLYKMVHFVQSSGATRSRQLQSKSRLLWGYMGKVTFNPRLQQVRIVVVEEASTWEPVPHTSDSMEKTCLSGAYTSPMEYITKVMRVARYSVHVCVFEPWKLELVALRNILRLNTCHRNIDRASRSLWSFVCGKGLLRWE